MILEEHLNTKIHENETLVYELNDLAQQKEDIKNKLIDIKDQYENEIMKLKDDIGYNRKENEFLKQVNIDMQKRVNAYSEENEKIRLNIEKLNERIKGVDGDIDKLTQCMGGLFSIVVSDIDDTPKAIQDLLLQYFKLRKNKFLVEKSSRSGYFLYTSNIYDVNIDAFNTIIQYIDSIDYLFISKTTFIAILESVAANSADLINNLGIFLESLHIFSDIEVYLKDQTARNALQAHSANLKSQYR